MTSPHVSFLVRSDSVESCFEDMFENEEDTNEDDLVNSREEQSDSGSGSYNVLPCVDNEERCDPAPHGDADLKTPLLENRSMPVRYFTHKYSFRGWLRWFFIRNTSTRLAVAIFDFTLKILICAAYVIRVHLDDVSQYECNGVACARVDNSSGSERALIFEEQEVNWYVLVWVQRSYPVWVAEISLAFIELIKALLMVYIATKGHRMEQALSLTFILELLCGFNMLITLYPGLINLFVPVYLNCWLARLALGRIYSDLHLTSQRFQTVSVRLTKKMVLLVMNIACLTFTTMCSIQHIQRASADKQISLFDSFYFVIVTFSTVGFGDITPDMWLSRLFMIIMMCLAFATLPSQIQGMITIYREREKAGGEYSKWFTNKKHVIVCASSMTQDTMMDFLNEFYIYPRLEEQTVIILCCQELDSSKRVITTDPRWSENVIYMKGSALKHMDLTRCHAQKAYACFFLPPRPTQNKALADRHTVLRSWAVKDFAPNCKQYVYLFKAVNRLHVKYAEHVMCEDEFSFALLANNCLYPGFSTLVSLLVHSTKEQQKGMVLEPWQQLYGRHAANEIFHIQVQKSVIFSQYQGETFPRSSADAHYRFGVALLGVIDSESPILRLQLNPGPQYRLKATDMLFYMSVCREEYSKICPHAFKGSLWSLNNQSASQEHLDKVSSPRKQKKDNSKEFDRISRMFKQNFFQGEGQDSNDRKSECWSSAANQEHINATNERNVQNVTTNANRPLIHSRSAPLLQNCYQKEKHDQRRRKSGVVMEKVCDVSFSIDDEMNTSQEGHHVDLRHGEGRVLQFYEDMERLTMGAPPVITCTGVGRASCHIRTEIRDLCCLEWGKSCEHCSYKNVNDKRWDNQLIILIAEHASSGMFHFIVPLRSSAIGVNGLSPIILLLEEAPDYLFLESLAHFPLVYYMLGSIKSIDDLLVAGINKASHLVIVNRDPEKSSEEEFLEDSETVVAVQTISRLFPNTYVLTALSQTSNMRFMRFSVPSTHSQKKLRDSAASAVREIFRLPFAAGQVFSANMLDTLLYQTFTKGYLISFVRLLLGIDSEQGSGHLSSIRVRRSTIRRFPEYKDLYSSLCLSTGEVPFAIYRTERVVKEADKETSARVFYGDEFCDLSHEKRKTKTPKEFSGTRQNSIVNGYRFSAACKTSSVDLGSLIRSRLQSLDMTQGDYSEVKICRNILSYVITNPSPSEKLTVGDIIYVIQPSSMWATPSRQQYFLHRSHSAPKMSSSGYHVDRKNGVLKTPSKEGHFDSVIFNTEKETQAFTGKPVPSTFIL
ncbi:hypothetical protein BsWGS_27211 [Bradybaena similaris]